MTFRAMVDSQHKSPLKKRRMQSSSDAIQQEVQPLFSLVGQETYPLFRVFSLWCLFFFFFHTVYGLADSLYCSGDSHYSVCEVCQWNTEESWRWGGERSIYSCFLHLLWLMQQLSGCRDHVRAYIENACSAFPSSCCVHLFSSTY